MIKVDSPASLKVLLETSAINDVNAKELNDYTPLHWAVRATSSETVKTLIENTIITIDLDAKDINGYTPLRTAINSLSNGLSNDATEDVFKIIAILLEQGADPTIKDDHGRDILHALENIPHGYDPEKRWVQYADLIKQKTAEFQLEKNINNMSDESSFSI